VASSFDVWPTRIAESDRSQLRGPVARAADRQKQELERQGCKAAGYRLHGAGVEHVCSVRLTGSWRMITAFPAPREVAILLIGEHLLSAERRDPDRTDPPAALDVYASLYRGLGLTDWPVGDPEHPDRCCKGASPPVDPMLVDRFISASRVDLSRDRRREQRRTRQRRR